MHGGSDSPRSALVVYKAPAVHGAHAHGLNNNTTTYTALTRFYI